ncbi:MAG: GIY-YIG nuclease family protein, partial [Marinovum algicola]
MPLLYHVYILYSEKANAYYIGQTEDLIIRLKQHLSKAFPHAFTTKADDWVVFLSFQCENKKQSIQIEKHIKRMKSRKYIQDLKKYPEII